MGKCRPSGKDRNINLIWYCTDLTYDYRMMVKHMRTDLLYIYIYIPSGYD